jgi:hypothetical protein
MFSRVTTEDAALDSFQNVQFSIARFRELTGAYPTTITVVGHDFKRRRFEQLHRHALRWPKARFIYEGVPLRNEADEREAAAGEVVLSKFLFHKPLLCLTFYFPSVGQRIYSILHGPVRLSRIPRPKTRGAKRSRANSWLSCRCTRNARVVRVVPKRRQRDLPWCIAMGK